MRAANPSSEASRWTSWPGKQLVSPEPRGARMTVLPGCAVAPAAPETEHVKRPIHCSGRQLARILATFSSRRSRLRRRHALRQADRPVGTCCILPRTPRALGCRRRRRRRPERSESLVASTGAPAVAVAQPLIDSGMPEDPGAARPF